MEELLLKDPLFLTFKSKTDEAIALSEEKVQLSQRITRLMDNAITKLSSKIDEYGEERKVIEATQAEIVKNMDNKSTKKKQKEEVNLAPVDTTPTEETQTYCICGQVHFIYLTHSLAILW